jgi:hypothetical protein
MLLTNISGLGGCQLDKILRLQRCAPHTPNATRTATIEQEPTISAETCLSSVTYRPYRRPPLPPAACKRKRTGDRLKGSPDPSVRDVNPGHQGHPSAPTSQDGCEFATISTWFGSGPMVSACFRSSARLVDVRCVEADIGPRPHQTWRAT